MKKMWVARNGNNDLRLFNSKPFLYSMKVDGWQKKIWVSALPNELDKERCSFYGKCPFSTGFPIPNSYFPEIGITNSPSEVFLQLNLT